MAEEKCAWLEANVQKVKGEFSGKKLEEDDFYNSGPHYLNVVDWANGCHVRSFAASLVRGVYILQRDRSRKREGPNALAPPWWEFFHCKLLDKLDDKDGSIFGAIFVYEGQTTCYDKLACKPPRYIIAFRGTLKEPDTLLRDFKLNFSIVLNKLHKKCRFDSAIRAVRDKISSVGDTNIWLAGHSLGSAIALLTGKNLAKCGIFLETFLFNPPFVSLPFKKNFRRFVSSCTKALVIHLTEKILGSSEDTFSALASWYPHLFVNPEDVICAEYIGYFEHRKKMEKIGAGSIERLATKHSLLNIIERAYSKETAEPLHLIPSANLTVNRTTAKVFRKDHGLSQWWRNDLYLQSTSYIYNQHGHFSE